MQFFKGAGPLFTFKKDKLAIFVDLGGIYARFGLCWWPVGRGMGDLPPKEADRVGHEQCMQFLRGLFPSLPLKRELSKIWQLGRYFWKTYGSDGGVWGK